MGKKNQDLDEQPGSYFQELRNHLERKERKKKHFLKPVKILQFFDADLGSGINIPDPQHCLQNLSSPVLGWNFISIKKYIEY
jgi:hypothetical protein